MSESGLYLLKDGTHYPSYDSWWSYVESQGLSEVDAEEVWAKLLRDWAQILKNDLGEEFKLYDQDGFLILSSLGKTESAALLHTAQKVKSELKANLIPEFEDGAPIFLIVFDNVDKYYGYLEPLYQQDGAELMASAGVFLSGNTYPHIAIFHSSDVLDTQTTVAHELTHFYTSPFQIPRWLDEGLASIVQKEAVGLPVLMLDLHTLNDHRGYWDQKNLNAFWSGDLFRDIDANQTLAYQLAELLVRNLIQADRDLFHDFLRSAETEDGGLKAALEIFEVDLNVLAEMIFE